MVTSRRIAMLFVVLSVSAAAWSQPTDIDYRISLSQGGVPAVGTDVVYALVIEANWSTNTHEPFVARLTVPRELEIRGLQCSGGDPAGSLTFDAGTRVLTWSSVLDNPYIAFKSCPLAFRVDPAVAPGSPFALHATLTMAKPDLNPANNTASIGGVVLATSDLQVETTADAHRFRPGTTVRYTVTVKNVGPLDARDVVLVEEFSPHVTFVSFEHAGGPPAFNLSPIGSIIEARIPLLPAGATTTFRLVVTASPASEAANIVNRAFAYSGSSFDPLQHNNESRLITFAGPQADLAVAVSRGPELSAPRTAFAVRVSNDGPDAVNNVTVVNNLRPAHPDKDSAYGAKFVSVTPSQGTCAAPVLRQLYINHYPYFYWSIECSLGPLASGATATVALVVERGASSGVVRYSASVGPSQNDPRPENNHSQLTGTVRRRGVRP